MNPIKYGQGAQTIRTVPVDSLGIPRAVASATYSIVDLREVEESPDRTVQASAAATISSVSTTISAAAGPSTANPRRVAVASAAGLRSGGVYRLRDVTEARDEAVTLSKINGTELELTRPLMRAFAGSSTFVGMELEGTFPLSVANDEDRLQNGGGPFQVTWSYTIGSVVYVAWEQLWITRYGVAPWVTPDEVFRHLPGHSGVVGSKVSPEEAIRAATDDLFEHLQAGGSMRRDPAYFRGNISADLYVRKRAIVYMLRASMSDAAINLSATYAAEATTHANNLTEGRPPTRSVHVDPDSATATPGGEKLRAGGFFAPG